MSGQVSLRDLPSCRGDVPLDEGSGAPAASSVVPLSATRSHAQGGSHTVLVAEGRPQLIFAFHDNQTIPPGLVQKILVRDVGLSESEALDLL